MSVFGAVFGRRGDAGFSGPLLWVSSGVVGFNVAMFLHPVHDIFRPARSDVGASAKKFAQHTKNGSKWVFYGALGEYFRGPAVAGSHRASLLRRVPSSRAHLLAVLTLQCAAKPYWWHGGQPAHATTSRVNVRTNGPRPPPIGLTCASKGPRAQDAFTETEVGPDGSQASRRSLYARGEDGAAAPSALKSHATSNT